MLSLLGISLYVANILQRIIKRRWEQYLDFSFCHDRPFVISSLMVDLSLVEFFSPETICCIDAPHQNLF